MYKVSHEASQDTLCRIWKGWGMFAPFIGKLFKPQSAIDHLQS